jgi:hypothetical protein
MTDEQLAYEIARGIGCTGVEGGYGSISCSTAGDYPSMGVSQWEGPRGDTLLSYIDGGIYFAGRSYSDIRGSGELDALAELLDSPQGQEAQNQILAGDCLDLYIPALKRVPNLDDSRCFIYAGIWCPTSHDVVRRFLTNRADSYDLRSLSTLRDIFRDQYYIAASVGARYAEGYANRAENTFQYVAGLDLTSKYGVPVYGGGPFGV